MYGRILAMYLQKKVGPLEVFYKRREDKFVSRRIDNVLTEAETAQNQYFRSIIRRTEEAF
jgi:hypothetical protein